MSKADGARKYGEWLAECLRLGWSRDDLDALEALWWKYHDEDGRLRIDPMDASKYVGCPTSRRN